MAKKIENPVVLASSMQMHPDLEIRNEFNEVRAKVSKFNRMFARAEVGQVGESVSDKRVWKDVWMLNPYSTSDMPVRNVVYVGGPAWVPWKPTMEDLMHRGGEWAILADRVDELVDRSFGARIAVLDELGLSLLKATDRTWRDGTKHYGQTQRRTFPHWNEAMEEERAKERGTREPGGVSTEAIRLCL